MSNKLALTPPMGWNSWNAFEQKIDEKLIRDTADAMVTSGMRDAGYNYLVLDDGCSDHHPVHAGRDGGLHGGMSGAVAAVRRMAGLNSGLGTGLGGGLHRWATPEGARDEWSGVYAQRTRIPSAGPGGGRCPPVAVSR